MKLKMDNGHVRRFTSKRGLIVVRKDPNRRGAVAMELALVAPFLAVLFLGICEVGQVQRAQCYVSEAAFAGCVSGSLPGSSNGDVVGDVRNILAACKMTASSATITIKINDVVGDIVAARRNDKITVKVDIPISAIAWSGSHCIVPDNTVITKTIVMLKQG